MEKTEKRKNLTIIELKPDLDIELHKQLVGLREKGVKISRNQLIDKYIRVGLKYEKLKSD